VGRYRVTASFVCEGLLYNSTPDKEAPRIFKNRLQSAMRSFFNDVTVTIEKCERMKEKSDD